MGRVRVRRRLSHTRQRALCLIRIDDLEFYIPTTYLDYNTHDSRDKFSFAIDLIVCKRKRVSYPN
jgi:hypothetical protein